MRHLSNALSVIITKPQRILYAVSFNAELLFRLLLFHLYNWCLSLEKVLCFPALLMMFTVYAGYGVDTTAEDRNYTASTVIHTKWRTTHTEGDQLVCK